MAVRKRTTFEVDLFRVSINRELRRGSESKEFRKGLCDAISSLLLETRQYAGWTYLEPEAGLERDHTGRVVAIADDTRRKYLSLEEEEEAGQQRAEKLRQQLTRQASSGSSITSPKTELRSTLQNSLRAANNRADDPDREETESPRTIRTRRR